ncbi:MFS transporter [Pantoea sp. At-9b]|uniref:MFS transporter n=1 Tax=Pantoea sp. (strain At-9b) TaxID=592316 RepID=UPI0001B40A9F|nr:MFS transporter [Pantoea sp. At-9b]ADU72829.1 major facilitator superfamily MFS_1 [Pantoea sp. At-9b]
MSIIPEISLRAEERRLAWRLLSGTFAYTFGNGIAVIAAALIMSQTTGDPGSIGVLFIMVSLPQALLSFVAGRMADHYSPQRICLVANLISASGGGGLLLLAVFGELTPYPLYFFSFLLSACTAMIFPATNALIRHCVREEQLPRFSSRFEIAIQAGSLISVAIGGAAMDHFSPASVFLVSAIAYFISGLLIGSLRYRSPTSAETDADVQQVLNHYRPAGALLLYATGNVIITVTNTLMVILVVQYFSASATSLGIADALAGVGVIVSSLLYTRIHKQFPLVVIIAGGYLLCAICIFLQPRFGLSHYFVLFPLGTLFYGFARIGCRQLIYSVCRREATGRFFGYANAAGLALSVPATLAVSWLVRHHDVMMGYTATGLFIISGMVVALYILLFKRRC